jgi:hypothetical protein
MLIPIAEGARLAGISKSALFKAIKRGTVSGVRDEVSGEWRIQVSELERVYPLKKMDAADSNVSADTSGPANIVSADWDRERQHFESRISTLESERDYLRQALQTESEERRQLTRLLTQPQPSAELPQQGQRTPWILYVIGLSTLIAAGVAVWHVIGSTPQ